MTVVALIAELGLLVLCRGVANPEPLEIPHHILKRYELSIPEPTPQEVRALATFAKSSQGAACTIVSQYLKVGHTDAELNLTAVWGSTSSRCSTNLHQLVEYCIADPVFAAQPHVNTCANILVRRWLEGLEVTIEAPEGGKVRLIPELLSVGMSMLEADELIKVFDNNLFLFAVDRAIGAAATATLGAAANSVGGHFIIQIAVKHIRSLLLHGALQSKIVRKKLLSARNMAFISSLAVCLNAGDFLLPCNTQDQERSEKLKGIIQKMPAKLIAGHHSYLIPVAACFSSLNEEDFGGSEEFKETLSAMSTENAEHPALGEILSLATSASQQQAVQRVLNLKLGPGGGSLQGDNANDVSVLVKQHYEQHPYPRWTTTAWNTFTAEQELRLRFPATFPADKQLAISSILIAGCGTGRQAMMMAKANLQSIVIAADLSRTSLAYGIRKAWEMGVNNTIWTQADILDFPTIFQGHQFDFVESTGVLHHMADPMEGFKSIHSLLRPRGAFLVAVYSKVAREYYGITAVQEYIGKHAEYNSSEAGMNALRAFIVQLPAGHKMRRVVFLNDFYNLFELRDLLFHDQEMSYTWTELGAMAEGSGFTLLGIRAPDEVILVDKLTGGPFEIESPLRDKFVTRYGKESLANLSLWDEFEREQAPAEWIGMYYLWLQKPVVGDAVGAAAEEAYRRKCRAPQAVADSMLPRSSSLDDYVEAYVGPGVLQSAIG
jgi:ubiquinone/menaquinone biosynthesis C-methylase UbiE